jgi:hypothetical protein
MSLANATLPRCAHNNTPIVYQRSDQDCMVCVLAMFTGRDYNDIVLAARAIHPEYNSLRMAMTHTIMRRIAHDSGLVLLSGIYMDWRAPGIVGVVSKTHENCGHALFWDGETLHDPSGSGKYDRASIEASALEYTQRAGDLAALIMLEQSLQPAARRSSLQEHF